MEEPQVIEPSAEVNVGSLCIRCGLCCIALSAKVEDKEAEIISSENKIKQGKFCYEEKEGEGPNAGSLVIKTPCKFLLGRPMDYVACRIYKKTRPKVCEVYLCRIAVLYKLGKIPFDQALKILGTAFSTGRPTLFNWLGSEGEKELQQATEIEGLRDIAKDMVKRQGKYGHLGSLNAEEVGNILIANKTAPKYLVHSDLSHFKLNLLLAFYDRGDHELTDILPKETVNAWSPEQQEFAKEIYTSVMWRLRRLFKTLEEIDPTQE